MANWKEKAALYELKNRMKGDIEHKLYEDDNLFYRFLRARDFNVDKAEYMLRQHLEFRKQYDVDNLVKEEHCELFEKFIIITKLGYDKEGCLVKYQQFGKSDVRGIADSFEDEEWFKAWFCYIEEDMQDLKNQSKKLGKTVEKFVYIEDMKDFSFIKATDKKVASHLIYTTSMYMNNFPETLKSVYVINAPVYFDLFFSLLKRFLPNTILQKVKIYSDDGWKKDLLEVIDANVLPAFLGGTRTDPDGNPLCLTLIKEPELIPRQYYIRKRCIFDNLMNVTAVTVSRRGVHEVPLTVEEPGTYLKWEFVLKSDDIKFGILIKNGEGLKTEVVPLQKFNAHDALERGFYKCEQRGIYIVVFDNRYSYFKSKEIYYTITIDSPKDFSCHKMEESSKLNGK